MALHAPSVVIRTMATEGLQTVVFVGPSCPHDLVRAALPDALIAPPVRRGDLYRFRLFNFSVFVILDGVFTNLLAVSPREVIDVLQDGAAVIGASSMGALRAVDCGPAGAIGHGRVYRLFRRRVLSSEDEVAVVYLPEDPCPALSQSLVNIRFALHRARRSGLLTSSVAAALARSAESLPYERRTWSDVADRARVRLTVPQLAALNACDVKRDDALSCCRWTARKLRDGGISAAPRQDRTQPLGTLMHCRERTWDPLDGEHPDRLLPAFLDWLWVSGHGGTGQGGADADPNRLAAALRTGDVSVFRQTIDLQAPSAELAALMMRFTAFYRSILLANELHLSGGPQDFEQARDEIAQAHGESGWDDLIRRYEAQPELAGKLHDYTNDRARLRALKRDVLDRPAGIGAKLLVWTRS